MDTVTILGARGSVPTGDGGFARFGGDTVCVLAELGETAVVLDAGTGLMHLPQRVLALPELPLLLSHLHLDHLLGFPLCPYLLRRGGVMTLWTAQGAGDDPERSLAELFRPPFWPVALRDLPGALRFCRADGSFSLGPVRVDTLSGVHPGGVTVFRLSARGKRLVFATDCTLTPELLPRMADFAQDCDLLLCDGQYSEEEWPAKACFGHNTWNAAARLAAECGAKRLRVIHHDPTHSDRVLEQAEEELRRICPAGRIARQGEVIEL